MPGRSRNRRPQPKKLSELELFGALLWFSQAMSPLVLWSYSETMAEYLSYPPVALAFIVLASRIYERIQQISARLANQNKSLRVYKLNLLLFAATLLTILGLIGALVMKGLAHYLSYTAMALVWLVLGIVAYFGLQQGCFKDTIIFFVWFALAYLALYLDPKLVLTANLYLHVLTMCTFNYLLKFDIF